MAKKNQKIIDAMGNDPEPHAETSEYNAEIFAMMKQMGRKPEGLIDPKEAAEYAKYLKANP